MINHQKDMVEDKERIDKITKISFDKLYTNNVIQETNNESFTNTNTNFFNNTNTNFNEEKFSKRVRKQSSKVQDFSLIDI